MVNIAFLLGSGIFGQDILHKVPLMRYIDKKNRIFVASRINPDIFLNQHLKNIMDNKYLSMKSSFEEIPEISEELSFIYDSDYLTKEYTPYEIDKLQQWLGISFDYISSLEWAFFDKEKGTDFRDRDGLNNYIAGLVMFFREFFSKNDVKFLVNSLEDDIFSVSAYYTAKKMGIKVIGFLSGRFPKAGAMFCENFNNLCIWNEENVEWEEIKSLYTDSTIVAKDVLVKNDKYWSLSSFLQRSKGIIFFKEYNAFKKKILKKYDSEKFIWRNKNLLKETYSYFVEISRRYLIKLILMDPNFDDNYLLFPLHYTKDAQMTFREPSVDQFRLISDISRALPVGYYLYVKPHPHYLGTDIGLQTLRKLSKFKNVKIINPLFSQIKLLKNSKGVITLNSTTGFESMIMEIPVLTFGHDFYCKKDLCYVIRDINELAEKLVDMLKRGSNKEYVKNFVKTTYSNTIWIDEKSYENGVFVLNDSDGKRIASALDLIIDGW